ncbi:MAG: DUF2071 domain-containing protein [Bacillaceae bacterium]|nr:DUF2071 domain-containing protein [Bacillaceae bacterium]
MKQTWHRLLFAHWPVAPDRIKPFIPDPLELDTYDGKAWVGIVPFYMSGIRYRFLPPVPFTSSFAEINVRTYVTLDDKPGVYFFSLDAASLPAVRAAKLMYKLPYYHASITQNVAGLNVVYDSSRKGKDANARFSAVYQPLSPVYLSRPGNLDHWLTERYCLYTFDSDYIYRCEIDHEPWPLQTAEAEIKANSMLQPVGVDLPGQSPLCHYSEKIDVRVWPLEKVTSRVQT